MVKRIKSLEERQKKFPEICIQGWDHIIEYEPKPIFNAILSIAPNYKGERRQRWEILWIGILTVSLFCFFFSVNYLKLNWLLVKTILSIKL